MNHKVNSVQDLHESAVSLYEDAICNTADVIISDIIEAVNVLKDSWHGKDAGIQIQRLVIVHNEMVTIRNILGELTVNSTKIAANYRNVQNANGAGLEELGSISCETKTKMADYSDLRDTIDINENANNGKAKIENALSLFDAFISKVQKYYGQIMDNWTSGTNRDSASDAFDDFIANSNRYKETLNDVVNVISNAIKNYQF